MKTTIDPTDVQALADKIICGTHATTFDTTADPVTDRAPDPVVRKKLTEFLSTELNALLKAA
jgi:hypothetical protein